MEIERKEQESLKLCLYLSEKGNKFLEQKNKRIDNLKNQIELKEAQLLKLDLIKSKNSYNSHFKKHKPSTSTDNKHSEHEIEYSYHVNLNKSCSPDPLRKVPKLKLNQKTHIESISTSARTKSANNKNESHEFRNKVESNNRRYKIIKNLTSRAESQSQQSNYRYKKYINPETERSECKINNKSETKIKPFMLNTNSKKQQLLSKADYLTKRAKQNENYTNQLVTIKNNDIIKKNKNMKIQSPLKLTKKSDSKPNIEDLKKSSANLLSRNFKNEYNRILSSIIDNRSNYSGEMNAFISEINYNKEEPNLQSDFYDNHLSYADYLHILSSMNFIFKNNETDNQYIYLIFNIIKGNNSLECINKNDFLKILQFVQGYKKYSDIEFIINNEENKSNDQFEKLNENSLIWSTLKSNRLNSLKKVVKKEEYEFKPKLYINNKYKVESIKPEDRCLKWNQNKKIHLDSYRNEIETQRKNIEDQYINHKLQINSNKKQYSKNKNNSESSKNSLNSKNDLNNEYQQSSDKNPDYITDEEIENDLNSINYDLNNINSKFDNYKIDSESTKNLSRHSSQSKDIKENSRNYLDTISQKTEYLAEIQDYVHELDDKNKFYNLDNINEILSVSDQQSDHSDYSGSMGSKRNKPNKRSRMRMKKYNNNNN
eukprot:Mrub_01328.p1 GENE.Mrub_01328~~Mrub_01328.p1  ORF type:complete len:730 (+),score=154.88 Mrub_01328:225-2192(+)